MSTALAGLVLAVPVASDAGAGSFPNRRIGRYVIASLEVAMGNPVIPVIDPGLLVTLPIATFAGQVPVWRKDEQTRILFRPTAPGKIDIASEMPPPPVRPPPTTPDPGGFTPPPPRPELPNPSRKVELFAPDGAGGFRIKASQTGPIRGFKLSPTITLEDLKAPGVWECRISLPSGSNSIGAWWKLAYPVWVHTATFDMELLKLLVSRLIQSLDLRLHLQTGPYASSMSWDPGLATQLHGIDSLRFHLPLTPLVQIRGLDAVLVGGVGPYEGRLGFGIGLAFETGGSGEAEALGFVDVDVSAFGIRVDIQYLHPPAVGLTREARCPDVAIKHQVSLRTGDVVFPIEVARDLLTLADVVPSDSDIEKTIHDQMISPLYHASAAITSTIEGFLASLLRIGPRNRIYSVSADFNRVYVRHYEHIRGEDLI